MDNLSLPNLITNKELFEDVLLAPCKEYTSLRIVSGFATASMARRHLDSMAQYCGNPDDPVKVELIVGMTSDSGIGTTDHELFKRLTDQSTPFQCSYIQSDFSPVHSKAYVWFRDEEPILAYAGSANYTQNAFFSPQEEILTQCNPQCAFDYFQRLIPNTILCNHIDAEQYCRQDAIIKEEAYAMGPGSPALPTCELPLYSTRTGTVQNASGLNWGQSHAMKNANNPRNRDDAYLTVPAAVRREFFFPPRKQYFSVRTDDGYTIICVIAQQHGKAIHTPQDNSEFGIYFRARLGVDSGQPITLADLDRYGRRTVTFVKLDEEDYYMDFSPES